MRSLGFVLLLASLPTLGVAQDWTHELHGPHLCAHAKAALAESALPRIGDVAPAEMPRELADTDVLHYHLDIELDPVAESIAGSNTMTVESLVDGLTTFQFRLWEGYNMAVTMGGAPVAWTRIDFLTVEATLDRPYNTGEVFELRVDYDAVVGQQTAGALTFDEHSGHSMIWSHSQPWYAAAWWPAKDYLPDKSTADLWFTVPDTMLVASNGVLEGVDPVALDKRRYRWKTEYQTADYLYCLGATNYDLVETTWEYGGHEMPIALYIYPEDNVPANTDVWLANTLFLSVFSDLYGLYPFVDEKYGMCQTGFGGGMEHQTMTSQGGFWEYITVHEAAHQWWGDNITCATWHDVWLNEGFATYSEALFYENAPGSPGEPYLHGYMEFRRPNRVDGSVYCYDISDPNRIFHGDFTYTKGAWVMHMLRHVVGTDVFYDILAAYRALYEGGVVTTDQFQAVCEDVAGRDLDWFFWEWVYSEGAPAYKGGFRELDINGRPYVELYLRQSQSLLYPTFTMPIDIQVTTPGGTHTHVVWNDFRKEHLLFEIDSPGVSELLVDPSPWILRTNLEEIPFAEGPPKIVSAEPAPNSIVPASGLASLAVVFHKNVTLDETMFALAGDQHGAVPLTFAYDPGQLTATLTLAQPLLSDTYTLTVSDDITCAIVGQRLDGELVKPDGPEPLPSGNGQPGGSAESMFAVTVPGDMNCDGPVDFGDINPFIKAFTDPAGYQADFPSCPIENGDVNEDGLFDFGDINPFVALLAGV